MKSRSGLWGNADFMRLWIAQAVSAFGSRITRTALPIIAVATLGESERVVALLASVSLAPAAVLALFAGGFVDRGKKRRILVLADAIRAVAIISLTIAWACGVLSIVHVCVVGATVGAASALFQIADIAYLPALVARADLVEGNAKLQTTDAFAEISGPASAGVLIAVLGAPLAVVIDAVSYVWSAVMLGRIEKPEPPAAAELPAMSMSASMWQTTKDLRVGMRAVFGNLLVRPIAIASIIWNASYGFFAALYTLFCLRTLGLSQSTFGIIIAMGGVGSIIGAFAARPLARVLGLGRTILVSAIIIVAIGACIPLAGGPVAVAIGLLCVHQLVGDGMSVVFNIHTVTLRQTVLPHGVLGRANAAITACTSGVTPIAAILAGVIAEATSIRVAIWIGMALPVAVPFVLWPLRRIRQLPSTELADQPAGDTIR
ncbi:MAG: MFS transporter [Kofleriaceae bacterium]